MEKHNTEKPRPDLTAQPTSHQPVGVNQGIACCCCSMWFRGKAALAIVFDWAPFLITELAAKATSILTRQESLDSGVATWMMGTFVSYKNVGRKILHCSLFLEATKNKPCMLLSHRCMERAARLLL